MFRFLVVTTCSKDQLHNLKLGTVSFEVSKDVIRERHNSLCFGYVLTLGRKVHVGVQANCVFGNGYFSFSERVFFFWIVFVLEKDFG